MKMRSSPSHRLGTYIALLVIILGIGAYVYRSAQSRKVVDARLNSVAYADGSAEILITDSAPDQITHTYRAQVQAVGAAPWWLAPDLVAQGGAWQRIVYTFNNAESDTCQNDIFFMDRVNKTTTVNHIDSCIRGTLDEHDVTHFIATSVLSNTMRIDIGTYQDGKIVASHEGPANLALSKWAFNWELNKAALYFDSELGCSLDQECFITPVVYLWNLQTGEWKEATLPTYSSPVDATETSVSYDHVTDAFSLAVRLINGTTPRNGTFILK